MPDVILKVTDGYSDSNGGYVNDVDKPNEIFILVNKSDFINNFKKSTDELIDTIKHEIRHWVQFNTFNGLPKEKILNRKTDVLGYSMEKGKHIKYRQPHHLQDLEFKTNVHSYAFLIRRFLNKNFPRSQWESKFKDMFSGTPIYTGDDVLDNKLDNIDHMRKNDNLRWRQFNKEIHELIFNK
jgi:hypothetical protein